MKPMTRTYKSGGFLFHENDHSRELYIIQEGRVRVFRKVGGREIPLAILTKGAVLGEMALIDGKPRSASAQALDECSVVLIDADTFDSKRRGVPPWFMSIIRMTSQKVRKANDRLQRVYSNTYGTNVILAMQYLFLRHGAPAADDLRVGVAIDALRRKLILLLGVTNQRVMAVVEFLTANQLLDIGDERLCIPDQARFDEYCCFLRLLQRKSLDKIVPIDANIADLLVTAVGRMPDLVCLEDRNKDLSGEDLWSMLDEANLCSRSAEVLALLTDRGLVAVRKGATGTAADPFAGMMLAIDCANWTKYCLFNTYKSMVPTL